MARHRYNMIAHIDYDVLPDVDPDTDTEVFREELRQALTVALKLHHRDYSSEIVVQKVTFS